jgi:hypothetical protein
MSRRLAVPLALVAAVVLVPATAAWNKAGHMVSGAVAYDVLKQDSPATVGKVVALLKKHPHYATKFAQHLEEPGLSVAEQEQRLFMMAARWADDIRGDDEYDRPAWHYVNFPYKPAGQPASVQTKPPNQDENILRAFEVNLGILKSADASDEKKAVALCWVFHLVGDVHQPLHVTSLFTTDFPTGDRGGTRFYIRVREGNAAINLHQFWDDLIIGSDRFTGIKNRAVLLRLRPDLARANLGELAEKKFVRWAAVESLNLTKDVVYRGGRLEGSPTKTTAPLLPEDYPRTVKPIAERRIVLAGYRLAALMAEVFAR